MAVPGSRFVAVDMDAILANCEDLRQAAEAALGVTAGRVRFLHNGRALWSNGDDWWRSPRELGIEEGDTVWAVALPDEDWTRAEAQAACAPGPYITKERIRAALAAVNGEGRRYVPRLQHSGDATGAAEQQRQQQRLRERQQQRPQRRQQ